MSSTRRPLTRQIISKDSFNNKEDKHKLQTNEVATQSLGNLNNNSKAYVRKAKPSETSLPAALNTSPTRIKKKTLSSRNLPHGKADKNVSIRNLGSQQKISNDLTETFTKRHQSNTELAHSVRNQKLKNLQGVTSQTKNKNSIKLQQEKTSNHAVKPALNTFHNVTVFSPPVKKKQVRTSSTENDKTNDRNEIPSSTFKTTYALEFERKEKAQKETESQLRQTSVQSLEMCSDSPHSHQFKNPVAYEVKFTKAQKGTKEIYNLTTNTVAKKLTTEVEEDEIEEEKYSDDFESYESDFESASSTQSSTETQSQTISTNNQDQESVYENHKDELNTNKIVTANDDLGTTDYTSNATQRTRDLELEKLDSGNYELTVAKPAAALEKQLFTNPVTVTDSSLDTTGWINTEQFDSGISTNSQIPADSRFLEQQYEVEVVYGGYKNFFTQPIRNQRGEDLMQKIRLDSFGFTIFEMKPISYESFMQIYGKLHTVQTSTQTQNDFLNSEVQTTQLEYRTMWTQHPAPYNGITKPVICGDHQMDTNLKSTNEDGEMERSLQTLKSITCQNQHYAHTCQPTIDMERLNAFLMDASIAISSYESTNAKTNNALNNRLSPFSSNCYFLEFNLFQTLKITRLYSNPNYDAIITVHKVEDLRLNSQIDHFNFCNLLMVWNVNEPKRPLRLLSTWHEISCAIIVNDFQSIIAAAATDGVISLWDLRESNASSTKLGNNLAGFSPSLSTIPIKDRKAEKQQTASGCSRNVGACVDIKSFSKTRKSNWNQFCSDKSNRPHNFQLVSLHETGLLTIWTLLETAMSYSKLMLSKNERNGKPHANDCEGFEYRSPWSRIKLIQSQIIDLSEELFTKHLNIQNQFIVIKNLFQRNIYNNKILQELQSQHLYGQTNNCNNSEGIRFHSLDVSFDTIYVTTNRNFILTCSKSLKSEHLRRIDINDCAYSYPTIIKALPEQHFVLVGLSNGSVMILNCNYKSKTPAIRNSFCSTPQHLKKKLTNTKAIPVIGKSCAIQNIILNEKLPYDYKIQEELHFDDKSSNANINTKKSYELRAHDQQVIITGSQWNENSMKNLEVSPDGSYLFMLIDKDIRIYNLHNGKEIHSQDEDNLKFTKFPLVNFMATCKDQNKQQYLILQLENDAVEIHKLKV